MTRGVSASATRTALIEAAERLIAEQGMGHVSHREVAGAAGQRNPSVVNYHFGSFDGLVLAILEHRMATVNLRRRELWEKAVERGTSVQVATLAEAFILPLYEYVEDHQGRSSYARFLAQVEMDPRAKPWEFAEGVLSGAPLAEYQRFADPFKFVVDGLRVELDRQFERDIAELRIRLAVTMVIHGMAAREQDLANSPDAKLPALPGSRFLDAIIDTFVNIISGPSTASLPG